MKLCKTSVLGENFLLFSQQNFRGPCCAATESATTLGILPSIAADFSLIGYTECAKALSDYYAAAASAAAFLVKKRGLPLSEILFETPVGNVFVTTLNDGFFEILIPKCKYMITKTVDLMGCEVTYSDFQLDGRYRIIYTSDILSFDLDLLRLLTTCGDKVPFLSIVYSLAGNRIQMNSYTARDSSPSSLSLISAVTCAAFYKSGITEFFYSDAVSRFTCDGVVIRVRPEICKEKSS